MNFYLIFVLIFIFSFILAIRSMKDWQLPAEIRKLIGGKRVKGTIILGKKVKHYSSSSSSDSSV